MGDDADSEGIALSISRLAGVDPAALTSPVVLAAALGVPVRKVPPRVLHQARGMLCRVGSLWTVFVSDCLRPEDLRFVVGHELAEHHIKVHGLDVAGLDKEALCDLTAAELVAPRQVFHEAAQEHGPAFEQLALDFTVTQTCSALRFGEVERVTVGVNAPTGARIRGPASDAIRCEADVRRLARAAHLPGLRKVRLTDQRGRVALIPA